MPELTYTEGAIADLSRLTEFLLQVDSQAAESTASLIEEGLSILARHPLIGRRIAGDMRRLAISRGKSGYVALYEWRPEKDTVLVHAIRHQREVGFED